MVFGAGNIGRGFMGEILSGAGYHTDFVDVARPVIDALNSEGAYPVRHVWTGGQEEVWVRNVSGIDAADSALVSERIASSDLMATAVGVANLESLVPNLVLGLRKRFARGAAPLDIIICENVMDAPRLLEGMLLERLTPEEARLMERSVGLVEASIGRMVPVQTPEMREGDPLRVCVEPYGFLFVDKAAFKGEVPRIKNLLAEEPFDFFIKRKLYIHNMGHAATAYLGDYLGLDLIWEAIADENVKLAVLGAMQEAALALCRKYPKDLGPVIQHIDDLVRRFGNRALMDTCRRVGRDTGRKLAPSDRLIGAMGLCLETGVPPVFIALGTAAGIRRRLEEEGLPQSREGCQAVLREVCGLDGGEGAGLVLGFHDMLRAGATMRELRSEAERIRGGLLADIA